MAKKESVEKTVRNIRRKTRKRYSAEDKIRIVLEGLRGETTISELCRREGIKATCTTVGAKSFLRQANSAWLATQKEKLTAKK